MLVTGGMHTIQHVSGNRDCILKPISPPTESKVHLIPAPTASSAAALRETNQPAIELDGYWKAVQQSPSDLRLWISLIKAAESIDDIERLRHVYSSFFQYFPLCYGYWKKFADAEIRHGHGDQLTGLRVLQHGVSATPYSAELWSYYANCTKIYLNDPDKVRSIFEEGLAYNGSDYFSHNLWDKYIEFEEEQGDIKRVCALLSRALEQPLKKLHVYLMKLTVMCKAHPLSDLVSSHEVHELKMKIAEGKDVDTTSCTNLVDAYGLNKHEPDVSDEEVKSRWMLEKDRIYHSTKKEMEQHADFLIHIKRTYYHNKALDSVQLSAWMRYLDFMETRSDRRATVAVYERCLVPCASYPDFWERYISWLESNGYIDDARNAISRMILLCRMSPQAHLFAARFKERLGDITGARECYRALLDGIAPTLIEAVNAAANFERRQGNKEAACDFYKSILQMKRFENEADHSILPYTALHYATFLRQAYKDIEAGRKVLDDALEDYPYSRLLWEGSVFYEDCVGGPEAISRALSLLERCAQLSSSKADVSQLPGMGAAGLASTFNCRDHLSADAREELSKHVVELAAVHGTPAQVYAAERQHFKLFSLPSYTARTQKRKASEVISDEAQVYRQNVTAAPAGSHTWSASVNYEGYLMPGVNGTLTAEDLEARQAAYAYAEYMYAGYNSGAYFFSGHNHYP